VVKSENQKTVDFRSVSGKDAEGVNAPLTGEVMKLEVKTMEVAARAVHETYYGKSTWKGATPAERGNARQAVRVALSAFERSGLTLKADGQSTRPAAAVAPRPSPPRPALQRATR